MAYDEDLANRLREALASETVTEKKMFGGLAFLIGGNMSVSASGQGGLLVRVDPDQTAALLKEPGAEQFEMGGRGRPGGPAAMRGWLRVRPEALDDEAINKWVGVAVSYAKSLPPKTKK